MTASDSASLDLFGEAETATLCDRYKVVKDQVLGEGAFAIVLKGLDLDAKPPKPVAVKVYKDSHDGICLDLFCQSVEVLQALTKKADKGDTVPKSRLAPSAAKDRGRTGSSRTEKSRNSFVGSLLDEDLASLRGGSTGAKSVLETVEWGCCFVQLLAFSKDVKGQPGFDTDTNALYLVFELGSESLEDRLAQCQEDGKSLTVSELRELQWSLVVIVCGLHSAGYVHLDIKPRNIMRFKSTWHDGTIHDTWKLIDLDGAMRTGVAVRFKDIVFTAEYACPEVATARNALASGSDEAKIHLSRLMDVWSIGLCALEAIFLQPVLGPWYQEWRQETGCDDKFYNWLGDYNTDAIISGDMHEVISEIDGDMCTMLEGMLEKDPDHRACAAQCLTSRWFQPIREELVSELEQYRSRRRRAKPDPEKEADKNGAGSSKQALMPPDMHKRSTDSNEPFVSQGSGAEFTSQQSTMSTISQKFSSFRSGKFKSKACEVM